MIYAVLAKAYEGLKRDGILLQIQTTIAEKNTASLDEFIKQNVIVQVQDAVSPHDGKRELRCYLCGDSVRPTRWSDKLGNPVAYYTHGTKSDCIGSDPSNPRDVHQPCD